MRFMPRRRASGRRGKGSPRLRTGNAKRGRAEERTCNAGRGELFRARSESTGVCMRPGGMPTFPRRDRGTRPANPAFSPIDELTPSIPPNEERCLPLRTARSMWHADVSAASWRPSRRARSLRSWPVRSARWCWRTGAPCRHSAPNRGSRTTRDGERRRRPHSRPHRRHQQGRRPWAAPRHPRKRISATPHAMAGSRMADGLRDGIGRAAACSVSSPGDDGGSRRRAGGSKRTVSRARHRAGETVLPC